MAERFARSDVEGHPVVSIARHRSPHQRQPRARPDHTSGSGAPPPRLEKTCSSASRCSAERLSSVARSDPACDMSVHQPPKKRDEPGAARTATDRVRCLSAALGVMVSRSEKQPAATLRRSEPASRCHMRQNSTGQRNAERPRPSQSGHPSDRPTDSAPRGQQPRFTVALQPNGLGMCACTRLHHPVP